MFPSRTGGPRRPSSLQKPWLACLKAAQIEGRFTVHGLRRTFVDLARRARVDGVVTRALTGHVTEKMRIHYSTVGMDEKRRADKKVGTTPAARDKSGKLAKRAGSGGGDLHLVGEPRSIDRVLESQSYELIGRVAEQPRESRSPFRSDQLPPSFDVAQMRLRDRPPRP